MQQEQKQKIAQAIANHMKQTRTSLGLTQAKMAKELLIDVRTYCNIEAGRSLGSVVTLVMYLLQVCPDTSSFFDELKEIIDKYKEEGQL